MGKAGLLVFFRSASLHPSIELPLSDLSNDNLRHHWGGPLPLALVPLPEP
jgi:hypothetical protein